MKIGDDSIGSKSRGGRHRTPLLLGALLAAVFMLGALAPSASALPANFFGFQAAGGQAQSEAEMEAVARSGAKYWRLGFNCFDWKLDPNVWARWDKEIRLAWEHGINIIATVGGRCTVKSTGIPSAEEWEIQGSMWETFLYELVVHYGYGGTFWSGKANPTAIGVWEVWNEPNLGVNGVGGYEANGYIYGKLLKRSSEAIHAAQGTFFSTTVLFGGMKSFPSSGKTKEGFINKSPHDFMLEASGISGLASWVSGVALHPYFLSGERLAGVQGFINSARTDINNFFGSGKGLWITEVGWPVKPAAHFEETPNGDKIDPVDVTEQANLLRGLFDWVKIEQAAKNIQSLIYYMFRDYNWNSGKWDGFCGLRSQVPAELVPPAEQFSLNTFRPAWYVFQEETGAAKWPVKPGAQTAEAAGVSGTQATLYGTINPHGLPTGFHFEYGPLENWYTTWIPLHDIPAGWKEGAVSVNQTLFGLQPNTTYHYRIVGTNENNEIEGGGDRSFKTPAAPAVTAEAATEVALSSAKLRGTVNPNGYATTYNFEYGTTTSYGTSVPIPSESVGSGVTPVAKSQAISGLKAGTAYHFRVSASNSKGTTYSNDMTFTTWRNDNLGGTIASDPDISSWGDGRLDVFAKSSSNTLLHKYWNNNSWSGWEDVGGALTSGPGAVSWGNGRIDIVARTTNNSLQHWWWEYPSWHSDNLGGEFTADPDISSWGPGRLDVFGRGTDNALWHKYWANNSWSAWEKMGGSLASGPSAVSWSNNRIDVVARATDNTVSHWYWTGAWNTDSLGGNIASDPDISSRGENRLDVYAKGTDKALWHTYWYGGPPWTGWEKLGDSLASGPGAVSWGANRIDVVARANDNSVTHWYWLP